MKYRRGPYVSPGSVQDEIDRAKFEADAVKRGQQSREEYARSARPSLLVAENERAIKRRKDKQARERALEDAAFRADEAKEASERKYRRLLMG